MEKYVSNHHIYYQYVSDFNAKVLKSNKKKELQEIKKKESNNKESNNKDSNNTGVSKFNIYRVNGKPCSISTNTQRSDNYNI